MNYEQIDVALQFMEPRDIIVLQIPYLQDINLVRHYIINKLGTPKNHNRFDMVFDQGIIKVEVLNVGCFGMGYRHKPTFWIDRLNDRSYYKYIEF